MKKTPKKEAKVYGTDSQLKILFDHTNEHGICMLDARGGIVSWNMSAERLIGYSTEEEVGKNYSMFFSPEEIRRGVPRKTLAATLRKGRLIAEGIRVRKDGTHFWARSFLTLVNDGTKSANFFVLITQDITKGRALELRREEYIGIASHELKTPITTLSLYSELLAKRLLLDRDKKNLQMMRDIQGQAAKLVTLVDDLLVVSKIEGGNLILHRETFHLDALVHKIVSDLRAGVPRRKIVITGSTGKRVHADKARITQVLINIMNNALKYSPRASKIHVHLTHKKSKCIVSIRNHGPVISKSDQQNIFIRFFRAEDAESGKVSGSGLGLYISKQIMLKHRERLFVTSSEKEGTTFSFTLPCV